MNGKLYSPDPNRILIIDDDLLSRSFVELSLQDSGNFPVFIADGPSAVTALEHHGSGAFSCVVADYESLRQPADSFLEWIYKTEPALMTLLTVDADESGSIEEWLRAGALDVLRKPFSRSRIADAVATAVSRTAQNRKLDQMRREVESVGRLQHSMLGLSPGAADPSPAPENDKSIGGLDAEVYFRPCHQAGGDFFSQFRLSPSRYAALITDVSGHDLHSAYVSAYLQGMIRASLLLDSPLFDVLARCNQVLLDGWNGFDRPLPPSVSVCSVLMDIGKQTLQVVSSGAPLPVLVTPDGRCLHPGKIVSSPLGWFPFDPSINREVAGLSVSEGNLLLWTDGLEDLACQLNASSLSVAYRLFQTKRNRVEPAWLRNAGDDVMAVRLNLQLGISVDECPFHPLLAEKYSRDDIPRIDEIQDFWRRSLKLALPETASEMLHDILLCSREALLNALQHGCRPGEQAVFQACIAPGRGLLRLRVEDPGGGHDFVSPHSTAAEHPDSTEGLASLHRGLLLIDHLCSHVGRERQGAALILDFPFENRTL